MSTPHPLPLSPLVRLLAGWSAAGTPAGPSPDLAARWGAWLGALDTVQLQSALQAVTAMPGGSAPTQATQAAAAAMRAAARELQALRDQLTEQLQQAHPLTSDDQGFAPYRRRHLELQRTMASALAPLRARLRQALARQPGRLRQLAALDAVLAPQLDTTLQQQLARVLPHLQQRFKQSTPPATFLADWRAALLAELDLRLQPLQGLLDAWQHENAPSP